MRVRLILGIWLSASCVSSVLAQALPLVGSLEKNRYQSPTGEFSITLPGLLETGLMVSDTPEVVTVQDRNSFHASIACFPQDSAQRREEELRGRRDYLAWFFGQHVQPQFRKRYPSASIESARFVPELLSGALIVYNLLPGGSMLSPSIATQTSEAQTITKRGNLLFIRHNHIFVISVELAPSVRPDGPAESVEQQNEVLRERLIELVGRMNFTFSPA